MLTKLVQVNYAGVLSAHEYEYEQANAKMRKLIEGVGGDPAPGSR
jgi:hypothetical protein